MWPPGLSLASDRAVAGFRIGGVVQHAVGDDEIEAGIGERWAEQVHLHEVGVDDGETVAEALAEPQRIHAQVGADDAATPVHAEEVGELGGAAARLQHQSARRDLLVEQAGEYAGPGLVAQALAAVEIVVVGKRRLLVELLDDVGDVALALAPLVGNEELGDAVRHGIVLAALAAAERHALLAQGAAAGGAAHDIEERPARDLGGALPGNGSKTGFHEGSVRVEGVAVVELQGRQLLALLEEAVADGEHVELGAHEAAEGVLGRAHDGLAAHVE